MKTSIAPPRRRVVFLGTRGVPAGYGGFETFVEQLGSRLADGGDDVTVAGRAYSRHVRRSSFRGMTVIELPAVRQKYLETVLHTIVSAVWLGIRRTDIVYVCNVANVPAVILLSLLGHLVCLNVDGLEWRRRKWSAIGRGYYRACARLAAMLPVHLVTDATVIQDYYRDTFGRETSFFPYGADIGPAPDDGTLDRLDLEPGDYVLYVSRLEPENNAHVVIEAYRSVPGDRPLVIVGDAPYAGEYIDGLHAAAARDARVRLVGAIYGTGYAALQSHAAVYIQATEVGGTHPALVEAMGRGAVIVANDVPEHREVLADAGRYYRGPERLSSVLGDLLEEPLERDRIAAAALERARMKYSWDAVAEAYDRWFDELVSRK